MKPPKRLFRNRPPARRASPASEPGDPRDFQGARFPAEGHDEPKLKLIHRALELLERTGCIMIVPARVMPEGRKGRVIIVLRNATRDAWAVPWWDHGWIAGKARELGIGRDWLIEHVNESIARGWLPPIERGGGSWA